MGDYIVDMTKSEIAKLNPEQVAFVLMLHSHKKPTEIIEEHYLKHLLPNLHNAGFSNYHSLWGVDVYDYSINEDYLKSNGLMNTKKYRGGFIRTNAGVGESNIVVVIHFENDTLQIIELYEPLIRKHFSRLKEHYLKSNSVQKVEYWEKLMGRKILGFTIGALNDSRNEEIEKKQMEHINNSRTIENTYVSVSAIPVFDFKMARKFFHGGYLRHIHQLIIQCNYEKGGIDFAHWILCDDGIKSQIHLTLLPEKDKGKNGEAIAVWAHDLMDDFEKRKVGLIL